MTIIWDMAQDGNEWKGGRIMDPESGSIYRCKLKPIEGGATPSRCGWITDHFGLTWQIVPKRFIELIGDKNPQKVQAVIAAMMKMVKLDVAVLESAYEAAT